MQNNARRIDMTGSRLFYNMLLFAYPILISNFCQQLFNAADSMIVGRFCGPDALAAVGGTGPVVGLFTWGLMGFSIGADVVVSRMIGQKDPSGIHKAVHTAYFLAISTGLVMALIGILLSRPILTFMAVPPEIMAWSLLYIRIYFVGLFFSVVYNFGAACLRSSGDSQRPTRYMVAAGLLNVLLNVLFVSLLNMGVAGVAIATVLSQAMAATLVTRALLKGSNGLLLRPREIRADIAIAKQMVTIGLPACVQNALFSISNIAIQSSLNSFGSMTMAANSAAASVESFVYVGTGAINQTCTTFTGQNNGAGRMDNIRRVLQLCVLSTTIMGLTVGVLINLFSAPLLSLFTTDPAIISLGQIRLLYVVLPLFLNGIMDVLANSMRGMGSSVVPMVATLAGICGLRLLHVFTIFQRVHTLQCLYLCYPLSWAITCVVLFFLWRRYLAQKMAQTKAATSNA